MYIFPRQFGLHNVFTEHVDPCQTVQPFKDYTLREDEINAKYPSPDMPKIPKRLRGKAVHLVRKLQIQHGRCPYEKLLEHHCPVRLGDLKIDFADFAGFRSSNKSRHSRARWELRGIHIQNTDLKHHINASHCNQHEQSASSKTIYARPFNANGNGVSILSCSTSASDPFRLLGCWGS